MITCNEKDIEDWLWEHPNELVIYGRYRVERWLARQYRVPSGVIDLLGVTHVGGHPNIVIVEMKNVRVKSAALAQVCRYAADIKSALDPLTYLCDAHVMKAVITPETIDWATQFEADALDVSIYTININFDAKMSGSWGWKKDYRERLNQEYEKIQQDPIFEGIFDLTWKKELDRMPSENKHNEAAE